MKIVTRGKGKSAVAAGSYRSGDALKNESEGTSFDYSRKGGIVYTEILLPTNAPREFSDRSTLWNAVEKIEKASNAQLAREIEFSLPIEFTREQNIELARRFIQETFVDKGMIADVCYHDKNDGNPHAHVLLTTRPFNEDGTWGNDGSKASPDIARLMGTRLVNINEPDKDLILNAAVVKQLTGGDTLVARFLNENLFEFMPESKFFVNTNHLPQIIDITVFTSGRAIIIPFERHFTEKEQDKGLKRYLRHPNNLSGILNWLIEGYRLLRAEGLEPSARIKAAIAEYAVESDVMGLFLGETVVPVQEQRLSTSTLYNIYTAWAKSRGNKPIRVQSFVGELRNRYEIFHDRKIGNVIIGVTLRNK